MSNIGSDFAYKKTIFHCARTDVFESKNIHNLSLKQM